MSVQLDATIRTQNGKGASRRTRAAGNVPAVVYGYQKQTTSIAIAPKALIKALTGPKKRNAVITLNLKDDSGKAAGSRTVLVREVQAHPVKRNPTHVDFLEVDPNKPFPMRVPLEVIGKSKAFAEGAKLTMIQRYVTLEVKPVDVPEKIVFDVTNEGFGVIRAKQFKAPEGTKLMEAPETPLVAIKIPRGDKEEEAAAAAAAAAPAEGAAAAPAAGAAAAPAAGAKGAAAAPAADAKGGDKKK